MKSGMSRISYKYHIDKNDFARAGEASSSIKKILRQLGIRPDIVRRAAIATYEAEMNVVIHSEGGAITVYIYPTCIEIIAEDSGPGIKDVELAMKEGYSTAPDNIREMGFGAGMGLANMKRCSDYFDIETEVNKYTRVFMKIKL